MRRRRDSVKRGGPCEFEKLVSPSAVRVPYVGFE